MPTLLSRRVFLVLSPVFSAAGARLGAMPGKPAAENCRPTSKDILGPYYQPNAPKRAMVASSAEPGVRLSIEGTVSTCSGPLPQALVEVWQATADGCYSINQACGLLPGRPDQMRLRASLPVDGNGRYAFETIKPGHYGAGPADFRPSHIHYRITVPGAGPGESTELITQLYFEGDPYNATDRFSSAPDAKSRIIPLQTLEGGKLQGVFDITLPEPGRADLGGHDLVIHRSRRNLVLEIPCGGGCALELFRPSGVRIGKWATASGSLELSRRQLEGGVYLAQLSHGGDLESFHLAG